MPIRLNPIAAGTPSPAAVRPDQWVDWRERHDQPVWHATLWPNRSLTVPVRRTVLGLIAAGLLVPLAGTLGTMAFWGLLPFMAGTMLMVLAGLRRSDRDGRLTEEVTVWADEVRVERRDPSGRCFRWAARPFDVRLGLGAGPVEQYLTLRGSGRTIELGRFLSPGERVALADEVEAALGRAIRG